MKRKAFDRYSVSVPRGLADTFRKECKRRGRTQSWVVAKLMESYIGRSKRTGETPKKKEKSKLGSQPG